MIVREVAECPQLLGGPVIFDVLAERRRKDVSTHPSELSSGMVRTPASSGSGQTAAGAPRLPTAYNGAKVCN